jgi:NADH:ubiquinone oxidoreductase subunit 6 (subunit J)
MGLMFVFTLLYFPTGRLLSRRWRILAAVAWASSIAVTIVAMFAPVLQIQDEDKVISNPIGIRALGTVEQSNAGSVLFVLFICSLAGALASLVIRFRRSEGEERQQLKWFTYAGALVALLPVTSVLPLPGVTSDLIFAFVLAFLPIATGIAILKYRLYDIDVIINRTLVYGVLTLSLALVYVAGVVVLGGALRSVTGQANNNLAVAASTLGVAALFRPARSRIQSFIDRRFYRRTYDSARTLEAFSARLREEVELRTLTAHLLTAVSDTMQPANVSLWLQGGQAGSQDGAKARLEVDS